MKKEKKVWALTLLSLWWLSPNQTHAQQDSIRQLSEVVITATRSEQPVMSVPRSVTVINREQLEKQPFNSVGELLANHPGIFIVGANQVPGTNQSLFMRGANSNQVVILIDGTRITDPSSPSSSIDLAELSITSVERIEVIRGAHSTLFGGSAIGGAVNIITRKESDPGFHGGATVQAGTFGDKSVTTSAQAGLQYTFRRGAYINGSVFRQDVRGFDATLDTIRDRDTYKTADDDNFRKTDAYVKAGWRSTAWDTWISFKNTDQRANIDDGAFNDDDNAYVSFSRRLFAWHARYKPAERVSVTLLGSWSDSERASRNDSSRIDFQGNYDRNFSDSRYNGKILTNELLFQYKHNPVEITAGFGQYRESMRFDTYYFSNAFGFPYESHINYDSLEPGTITNYVFTQIGFDKGNFGLTGGSRFSRHSRFGSYLTFEISPYYRFGDLLVFASASSGFNAPSLYQLFDPTQDFGSHTTRGNPGLDTEKSLSLETGVKKEFRNGSYATLSLFRSITTDAIEYVYLWNKETPVEELGFADYLGDTYLNITRQEMNGIEFSGQINAGKAFLRGNVTWIDGSVHFSPGDIDEDHTGGHHIQPYNYGAFISRDMETDKLIRKPAFTGFAEAGYKFSADLVVTTALRHAGSRFDVMYDPSIGPFGALGRTNVKRYNLIDVTGSWQIIPACMVGVKIENVFDTQYQEIQGFSTRGRSLYVKLQYKW